MAAAGSRGPPARRVRPSGRARRRRRTHRGRGEGLMESASVAVPHGHVAGHAEHPPEANRSSNVEAQRLGMYLFIISEIMLFGAFFTAYFFMRVVRHDAWPAVGT